MSAIEFLENQYNSNGKLTPVDFYQAKEMEMIQKQEIRQKSYMEGYDEGLHDALNK